MQIINSIVTWLNFKRVYQIDLFKKFPFDAQQEVLFKLIDMAKKTEFGKKYHFHSIRSIKEYQERVPLQTYDSLKPYIERLMHGEQNILWPSDIRWFATQTSDSLDPKKGEMIMNWTYINPNFITGLTLTPGHGVWQLNVDGNYNYTWYAYALNSDRVIAATVRVSGVAMLTDPNDPTVTNCDIVYIYYHFDIAEGEVLPIDLATTTNFEPFDDGGAYEVRVPLTVTPLPPQ